MKKSQLRNLIHKSIKEMINERDLRKWYCYGCKGGFWKGTCHHNASTLGPRGQRPADCPSLAECEADCTRDGRVALDTDNLTR